MIIEDKIRDRQARRKFDLSLSPAANELDQFPACLSPVVLPRPGISNRELRMRQASVSQASAPRRTTRGFVFAFSNRELELLEPSLNHRKQTVAPRSNRELSTNQYYGNSHFPRVRLGRTKGLLQPLSRTSRLSALTQEGALITRDSSVLTGSGPQTEMAVTYRKQTPAHFLTGARIAHSETRARAKMDAETSRIR